MNNKERKMFAKYGMQRVRQEHTPRLPVKFTGEMAVWDHREPESKKKKAPGGWFRKILRYLLKLFGWVK